MKIHQYKSNKIEWIKITPNIIAKTLYMEATVTVYLDWADHIQIIRIKLLFDLNAV